LQAFSPHKVRFSATNATAKDVQVPDKGKCCGAQALGEEALAINRTLNAQVNVLALDLTAQPDPILNQANR